MIDRGCLLENRGSQRMGPPTEIGPAGKNGRGAHLRNRDVAHFIQSAGGQG